jgi:oligopeptidase A
VWKPGVEFYRIERGGELVGQFYLDQPARNGKRGGAWMDDVRARWLRPDNGKLQTPVAHLVCNFADGVGGKPALLTHDDVTTLFHEFGHGLHHMLTQVNERDVLKHMTAHVDTGAPLPRALFDKMLAAKNFQSGMQTLRQVEFSLFDMLLHTSHNPADDLMALLAEVRKEVAVIPSPAYSRTAHTFSHIFSGGYAAGYYSYKWAEVLSADAYAAFEETATASPSPSGEDAGKTTVTVETGRKYRKAILEAGGSRPAMESFKAFRGREPSIDALLRHQGMA